jgi:hypothetical protein
MQPQAARCGTNNLSDHLGAFGGYDLSNRIRPKFEGTPARALRVGKALGVSFQQIQKYENGGSAIASTCISDLCRTLEFLPNDLFGLSACVDGEFSHLDSWGMKTALKLQELSPALRQSVDGLLDALPKRRHSVAGE